MVLRDTTNTSVGDSYYNIQVAKSSDLIHWKIVGDALPAKPPWADRDFWAPHDLYDSDAINTICIILESLQRISGKCIGVAISKNPEGPFTDVGKPLMSGEGFVNIDPMAFDDPLTGKKYLYWGSGHKPIKVRELNDDRLSFKPGSVAFDVVTPNTDDYSRLVEGAWLHYRNGDYYMFIQAIIAAVTANYAVMVARSKSVAGPFERLSEAQKSGRAPFLPRMTVGLHQDTTA